MSDSYAAPTAMNQMNNVRTFDLINLECQYYRVY